MAEHEIFWAGGAPLLHADEPCPAETEAYAERVTGTCTAAGYRPQRYVAAKGPYGSWLVELENDAGETRRVIWNGRESCLSLEASTGPGAWRELRRRPASGESVEALLRDLAAMLGEPGQGPAPDPA